MRWYEINDEGLAVISCPACGAPVTTPLDRLARDLMRGRTFCWECSHAWRDGRLHLKVDPRGGRVGFFVDASVARVFESDVPVVEELEDRQSPVVMADIEPDLDTELEVSGCRRDLGSAVAGIDVPDLGVGASVGDVGNPLAGLSVVVVEASDASAAGEGVGKVTQRGGADTHLDAVDLDVSVVQDAGVHNDSSSVGGDGVTGGDPAPSVLGASEPTEEMAARMGSACGGCRSGAVCDSAAPDRAPSPGAVEDEGCRGSEVLLRPGVDLECLRRSVRAALGSLLQEAAASLGSGDGATDEGPALSVGGAAEAVDDADEIDLSTFAIAVVDELDSERMA